MKVSVIASLILAVILPRHEILAQEKGPAAEHVVAEAKAPRVAVIGASVSAGYGTAKELEVSKPVALGVFLETLLADEASLETEDLADNSFFTRPEKVGRKMTDDALKFEPDAVVALDFLFWYSNGTPSRRTPRRLDGLEDGLLQLARFDCPVIVGNLPDVGHALDGEGPFGGPLLNPSQIASDKDRKAINERIAAWAEERPNVRVLPLDSMMKTIVAGEEITVRKVTWKPESLRQVLLGDLLHLTPEGTLYTALRIADEISQLERFEKTPFDWNPKLARKRLEERLAEARAKKAAIDKRRNEAAKRREERKRKKEAAGGDR